MPKPVSARKKANEAKLYESAVSAVAPK